MVMELDNGSGNIAFAEHQNQQMVAARSNYVLSGLVVTAAAGSNLLDSSDDVDISDGYCFNNNTLRDLSGGSSPASIDLSTAYSGLSTGQSRYVFIYVNTGGTVVAGAGDVATTGQQYPPDIADSTVVLAMVILTHLDTIVDTAEIEDWLIRNPIGSAMGDNEKSSWGDDGDLVVHHDNAHGYINNITGDLKFLTGKISLSSGTNINEFSIDGTLNGNSDDAVPTEQAVKTYVGVQPIDLLKLNGISTYTQIVHAADVVGVFDSSTTILYAYGDGCFIDETGLENLTFVITPPEWLVRYAEENSKTITATTVTIGWNNSVSADYITRLFVLYAPYDSAGSTNIYDDATDLGDGSTGFRTDVANFTDQALNKGDAIDVQINVQQGTVGSCIIKSFQMTYTLA